jgi:hypothetical protein
MNTPLLGRLALIVGAAALLSACGGSSIPAGGPYSAVAGDHAARAAKTFHYTGREQAFLVPKGVRQINVVMRGAAGGGKFGGRGGRVHGVIRVRPGEILFVFVGGQASSPTGGFNGGATGGYGSYCRNCPGFGGGGASDVREGGDTLSDRVLVVGGGGGEGGINPYGYKKAGVGGKGGGKTGGAGGNAGGSSGSGCGGFAGGGGTQYGGGSGGAGGSCFIGSGNFGQNGSLGSGGRGGQGGYAAAAGGGGGGGGYYGGGGGGAGSAYNSAGEGSGGGGGGGSSWAKSSVADFRTWAGWKSATSDGLVVFSW